jgi:hypothetical protein
MYNVRILRDNGNLFECIARMRNELKVEQYPLINGICCVCSHAAEPLHVWTMQCRYWMSSEQFVCATIDDRTTRHIPISSIPKRQAWKDAHGGTMVADVWPLIDSAEFGFDAMSAHVAKKIYYCDVARCVHDIHLRMQKIGSRILLMDDSLKAAKKLQACATSKIMSIFGEVMAWHLLEDSKSHAPLKTQDALFAARTERNHLFYGMLADVFVLC